MPSPFKSAIARKAALGKYPFFVWIAYQTIKGTLTTSLIWIPLFYHMFSQH